MDTLLKGHKVIVCVGSGGVGKTTMAASLAIRARQIGLRTLVITVDPAKRLATAMGLDLTGVEERLVPNLDAAPSAGGTLSAAIIDSKKTFDDFIINHSTDPDLFKRLSKNRLYQQLSTTLSGSQEFTALERLLQAVESNRYDLVILDTPPTQHAIDFLSAPERIRNLFQDTITRWFMNPAENSGFLGQGLIGSLIGRGTRVALKSLEALTGARFIDELIDFFHSIQSIQKTLRDRTEKINQILMSNESTFVLVTSFDAAKLLEAQHLSGHLERFGYSLGACILNRAFPESLPDLESTQSTLAPELQDAARRLVEFHARVKRDHEIRFKLFQEFENKVDASVIVVQVPEYRQDLFGLEDLEAMAEFLGKAGR
ncbi:ArsA family ATPase [soil metagenome]